MPDFDSIGAFNRHLDRFVTDMSNDMLTKVGREVGKRTVAIADEEAAKDLGGDRKFSGWARVGAASTKAVEVRPGVISVRPAGAGAAAVWTTVTQGRNQGNAGGFSGPGANRSTGATARTKSGGVRKVRARGGKRWNGTTKGKGTADRATSRMEPVVEQVAQAEMVKTINRFFN